MLLETEILNDVQSAAVRQTDGPVLIFAGAGSGKTRVLTHRIAYLLGEMRVAPERILAVTFTNKAAGEMKSRLHAMIGPAARDLWVGTFHAMCVRILRRDGSRDGIGRSFAVIDDSDQRQLVKEILDDLDYDERQLAPGACLAEIDKAKNALLWPEEYAQRQTSFVGERIANVYAEYQRRLAESNSLDFDDLIVRTIDLLERDTATREKYQDRFEYVLVDEYQDVNAAQYRLVRAAGGAPRQHHRRRRRRSVDLLVARQRLSHDPTLRRRLSTALRFSSSRRTIAAPSASSTRPTRW